MSKKEPSLETKRQVEKRWGGRCAFCGKDLTNEIHHIISRGDNPELIDDPDNLILLCSDHHTLTQKYKPNGKACISFSDIEDLKKSKYVGANKSEHSFSIPQDFEISLGGNICCNCPQILVINDKPLIEIWPQKLNHYSKETRMSLYMRFFDEENNFIGGMFANRWASVTDEEWELKTENNTIELRHKTKPIFVKFDKSSILSITGTFYFDGIKIDAKKDGLALCNGKCVVKECAFYNGERAFCISGNKDIAMISI